MDPLAGKYPSWSPYNYVLNNPIHSFDPDGRGVRDFNNFVSKEKVDAAAKHNRKILTPEVEIKMMNEIGPTVLDVASVGFLLGGPAGAPFAAGSSWLSFIWSASIDNHDTDAIISLNTSFWGTVVKNPKKQLAIAAFQVGYDLLLSGEDNSASTNTDMFAPDNTNVTISLQQGLIKDLGWSTSKSPKEMWEEINKESEESTDK